jgi:single-strand DNA-binding protein
MSDVNVTVIGHVGTNPSLSRSANGTEWSTFRMASTRRVRDARTGEWRDGETLWFTVKTWNERARNVSASVKKGDPVVVTGRLAVEEWEGSQDVLLADGSTVAAPEPRFALVVEAQHVGPDATRGLVRFVPVVGRGPARDGEGERQPDAARVAEPLGVEDPWATAVGPDEPGVGPETGRGAGPEAGDEAETSTDAELEELLDDGRVHA